MMRLYRPLLGVLCLAVLHCCSWAEVSADEGFLTSTIDMLELEYEDHCNIRAEADWAELIGKPDSLHDKLEQDKAYANIVHMQTSDVQLVSNNYRVPPHNALLARKLELLLAPGDPLLEIEQWNRLVTFGDESVHKLEKSTDYYCGGDQNSKCTLSDVRSKLAREQKDSVLMKIKSSWEKKLPDENVYLTQILPLLKNASKVNGYETVEEYWETLVEYEGAIIKAHELWDQVRPLYEKLQKYVAMKLKPTGFSVNTDISMPVHALGSLLGDDWSNVAHKVLPKRADIYDLIRKNLLLKHMGGREAFVKASKLIKALNLGEIDTHFWDHSSFDKTCPTKLVDFCQDNMRVFTCNDISLSNFLEAHENLMKVKYKEAGAAYSNNTHILREANRYSAAYEGIAGVASLLALTPHQLDSAKLVPIKYFERNPRHNRLVLQLLLALQDLPRLNYYLAADEWRLKTLKQVPAPIPLGKSWSDFRRSFSLVAPGDKDFLGDPHILFNKPYLGKFMGLILKYQIYQSYADEMYSDDANIVEHVANNYHRLLEPMTRAFSTKWPELVSDILAKREYGLESSGVTDYFKLLDEYLENELDPNHLDYDIDFEEPDPSDMFEVTSEKQPEETNEIVESAIDRSETMEAEKEDIKLDTEEPSENVLENKHQILVEKENIDQAEQVVLANDDEKIVQASSYQLYLWIGIGVVIAIILILIIIIAKKRYNHRKELERERKENSRA